MTVKENTPRLLAHDIVKTFGANRALKGVDLTVGDGEVVGLIGENGAGKSTILNIVSGVLPFDSGTLQLDGRDIAPKSYQEANRLGIFRVFQEAALIDSLPVYQNVFFGWEQLFRTRLGGLDHRALRRAAAEALGKADVDGVDIDAPTGLLAPGQKQSLDIARVTALAELLEVQRPVVLFDEPTTALDSEHEDNFLLLLQRLRGVAAVVFVSHRLPEIIETTDRITVFKDGESVADRPTAGIDENELHRLMVGRLRTENYYRENLQTEITSVEPRLTVEAVAGAGVLRDATLQVAPGEILGLAGTEGSGKRVLGEIIAGAVRPTAGRVVVNGREVSGGIGDHVRAGIAYVPPDRSEKGLVTSSSIVDNIQLASLHDHFATKRVGLWAVGRARKVAAQYVEELGIVAESIDAPVSSLSGGNAQKVLIAKWLLRKPDVLVLDEPTQGVDTGAREGIYDLLRQVAAEGTAVVLVSDDLPELIGLSNRVAVITEGRLVAVVDAPPDAKPDEHDLVALMIPGATPVPTTTG
ncbi:sugar ABC transporter ATP-binding protein [Mycobacterium sp. C31M]